MANNILIGPAGWSYPDWNGVVYPTKQEKEFDPLAFIAFYFNLIEINSTFYRIPSPAMTRRWVKRVEGNPDFLFTAKAFRNFTHEKKQLSRTEVDGFMKALSPIHDEGKLGFILIQFPWSLRCTREAKSLVGRLIKALSPFPVAVEVRHGSWAQREAIEFIKDAGATLCSIDQPLIGDSLSPRTSWAGSSGAYFRLHGRNASKWFDRDATRDERYDYLYSKNEISSWAETISKTAKTASRTFVVLNNHFRGQAVTNAIELEAAISNTNVKVPLMLLRAFPHLEQIAEPPVEETPGSSSPRIQGDLFGEESASREDKNE
ncbi:MAG: DUF72 domain-containing protein [Candidatus Latescibacteria bacterium]|nr:DUF72 domain-containing protein [Candidatus Latescibacterota bacterium]NIM20916.1 DUF72 domain-containing protein [Candidatus Latescibacterota bacterium]NIM65051.1 DUF72 domain-containing protein [Candidatus Latescibacterota bacterium]NIO01566.1 DUF72 domain-containing protein [Candidatus Latescibacterota bacterium]NIO28083.1 DUF72 domain-containing protein [Candidatus Latescibacterota bacterium]